MPRHRKRKHNHWNTGHSNKQRQHHPAWTNVQNNDVSPHPSTSSASSSSCALEIPGFVYDPEKKRYFKIAPNHATGTCNYTKEALKTKAAEEKRQNDVSALLANKSNNLIDINKSCNKASIIKMIQERSMYGHRKENVRLKMIKNCVEKLKPISSQLVFSTTQSDLGHCEKIEHMSDMSVNDDCTEILGLWSLQGSWVQRIQILKLCEGNRTERQESLALSAKPYLNPVFPRMHKVTDVCWADIKKHGRHILYTTMCLTGSQESLAVINTFNEDGYSSSLFSLGRKATWCCTWNPVQSQFCVGAEKCAMVLNVERRTMWEYQTNKSDPLTVTFSQRTGNHLYCGTRRGEVLTFDQRCRSLVPACTLQHKSSVCCLRLVHNEAHILSTDFSGKIYLWDRRQCGIVQQYEGNVNQYSRLPVHVDNTETILYTVGEDGYTRLWDFKQGTQLFTLPPPCAVSRETIPCVHFSYNWANREGNSGLVMGLQNKLHYYGTLPLG